MDGRGKSHLTATFCAIFFRLPHQFTYMMSEDLGDLLGESQNFNWNLEGIKFDDKVFFVKVTR